MNYKVLLEVVKISKFYSKSFNLIFAKGMHCYNARDLINVSETYLHYESQFLILFNSEELLIT